MELRWYCHIDFFRGYGYDYSIQPSTQDYSHRAWINHCGHLHHPLRCHGLCNGAVSPKVYSLLVYLTEAEINAALSYIEANHPYVEAEYQLVLKQAEEDRQYWEERSQQHLAHVTKKPPRPDQAALWAKLQEQKAKHELEVWSFESITTWVDMQRFYGANRESRVARITSDSLFHIQVN